VSGHVPLQVGAGHLPRADEPEPEVLDCLRELDVVRADHPHVLGAEVQEQVRVSPEPPLPVVPTLRLVLVEVHAAQFLHFARHEVGLALLPGLLQLEI